MSILTSHLRTKFTQVQRVESVRCFHFGGITQGFSDFYDLKLPGEPAEYGRAWTLPDVRRKSFDDLHRLWFILYKERNLILTEKQKRAKAGIPTTPKDEHRYSKVKQSMASIKHVLGERHKIINLIAKEEKAKSLPLA